jgi:hypothetical protein
MVLVLSFCESQLSEYNLHCNKGLIIKVAEEMKAKPYLKCFELL